MTTNDIERTFRFSGIYLPGRRRPTSILITLYLIHDGKNRPVFAVRASSREMRDAAVMALAWYTAKQRDKTTGTMRPLCDDPLFAERYGHGRVYAEIPKYDLYRIRHLIETGNINYEQNI